MNVINLLSEHISNQIAAGEVIQRPASVVKELLENSIDSGADEIKVFIKDGGRTSILVKDNGIGMTMDDAVLSFKRHATSKLKSVDDLFKMQTKGFRGEALASVSAIAHVSMKTKHKNGEEGISIRYSGGKLTDKEECICDTGTLIEVKNIFFNVPARRSFLKSDHVEFSHIRHEFERIAMAHHKVKLSLVQDDKEIYNLPGSNLRKRITDILGKKSNENLVPISEETDIVTIYGFIGKPESAKKTRGEQYLFVNNRYFKHAYFHHAISKAFDQLIPDKAVPSYFIFFDIDTRKIDINIHPTKTEINFEEGKFIYSILFSSVKQALGKYNISPTIDFDIDRNFDVPLSQRNEAPKEPEIKINTLYNPFTRHKKVEKSDRSKSDALNKQGFGQKSTSKDWQNFYEIKENIEQENHLLLQETNNQFKQDFLIRERYIITNSKSGILIIDSKRAQERMNYDDIMTQFVSKPVESQKRIFPLNISLSKDEISAWTDSKKLLKQLGFQFQIERENLNFDYIPSCLNDKNTDGCIKRITEALMVEQSNKGDLAHAIVLQLIQTNHPIISFQSNREVEEFIESLFSHTEHSFCPFGKPIMQTVSIEELTSKF